RAWALNGLKLRPICSSDCLDSRCLRARALYYKLLSSGYAGFSPTLGSFVPSRSYRSVRTGTSKNHSLMRFLVGTGGAAGGALNSEATPIVVNGIMYQQGCPSSKCLAHAQ